MTCTIGSSYTIKADDILFDIAQRELGDGNRWHEIMKPDGTPFTEKEAENLQEGQEICLPKDNTTVPSQNKAFPQALNWPNCIKPDVSQAILNKDVANYYDYWKSKYLKPSAKTPEAYYIQGEATGECPNGKGTSEGHGYGMIITALMAGYDPQAKTYYDGLFKMFDTHRSKGNPNLMGWCIDGEESGSGTHDSATDGDLDIAYSLLLAHEQWGSGGAINYLEEARKIINKGLKVSNITTSKRTNVGDWAPDSDQHKQGTRSSDWMTAHFRAFHQATGDKLWSQVADQVYKMIETITKNNAPKTGLMPDFAEGPTPIPAKPPFLETENDDNYYYNACRVPLRIVMDYGHYGTPEAKAAVTRMVNWIKSATDNDPGKIRAGYKLNGTPLPNSDYQSAVFIAPFVAASVSDNANQSFLNSGWNLIKKKKAKYFEDTYNLMCMLFISGNWWVPGQR
jgi:endoglucanase